MSDSTEAYGGHTIVTSPGVNCVAVFVGGAEVVVSVVDGELIVDVDSPAELNPTVFKLHPDFGTGTVVFRKNGEPFSYKDLHSFNAW